VQRTVAFAQADREQPGKVPAMNRCIQTTKSGKPCPFAALADSRDGAYCFAHDPDRKEARAAARKKGGRPKADTAVDGKKATSYRQLLTVQDILSVLSEAIGRVFAKKLETKDALAIATLSNTFLAALKMQPEPLRTVKAKSKQAQTAEAIRRIRELYGMTTDPPASSDSDIN
jgi:hypothetical protein